MTALTDINGQSHLSGLHMGREIAHATVHALEDSGFMMRMLMVWIAGAVVIYLVASYSLFGLGITMQQKTAMMKELNEANTIAELSMQQKHTEFARNNEVILQSMEKIGDLRYVLPTDTAVSRADISQVNQ